MTEYPQLVFTDYCVVCKMGDQEVILGSLEPYQCAGFGAFQVVHHTTAVYAVVRWVRPPHHSHVFAVRPRQLLEAYDPEKDPRALEHSLDPDWLENVRRLVRLVTVRQWKPFPHKLPSPVPIRECQAG